jgi:hypothetical protein
MRNLKFGKGEKLAGGGAKRLEKSHTGSKFLPKISTQPLARNAFNCLVFTAVFIIQYGIWHTKREANKI